MKKLKIFITCYMLFSLIIICFLILVITRNKGNYCYIDMYDNLGVSWYCRHNKCDFTDYNIRVKKFIYLE